LAVEVLVGVDIIELLEQVVPAVFFQTIHQFQSVELGQHDNHHI